MTTKWTSSLDPSEELDFIADFGGGSDPVLEAGELITSYTLGLTDKATDKGLTIMTTPPHEKLSGHPTIPDNTAIRLWLTVDQAKRDDSAFKRGVELGVIFTIVTNSSPARKRERTFNVLVKQL